MQYVVTVRSSIEPMTAPTTTKIRY